MAPSSKKWAVLIGVDFYAIEEWRLEGAVRDIEDIQVYLESSYSPINIEKFICTGQQGQIQPDGSDASWPTYDNVTAAFQRIIESASAGEFVYIHFSGHGTLRPIDTREYRDNPGSDAALVLYHPTETENVSYLRGIDMAHFFDSMVARGLKLTVVLDCCRSGGVSRGSNPAGLRARGIPWSEEVALASPARHPPPPVSDSGTGRWRDATSNESWILAPSGYALLAACGPDEIANEGYVGNQKHGILSFFLLKTLEFASKRNSETTLGAVHQQLCAKFHTTVPGQHPILIGEKSSIFLGSNTARSQNNLTTCNVIKVLPDGVIHLNVGYAHGVTEGDEYIVHRNMAGDATTKSAGYSFRVTEVYVLHSEAHLVHPGGVGKLPIAPGLHATFSKHRRPKAAVWLLPEIDPGWKDMVNNSTWLQAVDMSNTASFPYFEVGFDKDTYNLVIRGASGDIQNLPRVAKNSPNAARKMIAILEHLVKYEYIQGIESSSGGNFITDDAFEIELKAHDDPDQKLDGSTLKIKHGSVLSVAFNNNSDDPLYFALIDLTPLRKAAKIYPSDRDYETVIGHNNIYLRGNKSFSMKMTIPESLKQKGCTHIEDTLKFFITSKPALYNVLSLPELSEKTLDTLRSSEQPGQSQQDKLLSEALRCFDPDQAGFVTRTDLRKVKWTCQNFTVQTSSL